MPPLPQTSGVSSSGIPAAATPWIMVQETAGVWHIRSDWLSTWREIATKLNDSAPSLADGEPEPMEIVKTGPHRTVYRLRLDGEVYYVKRFRVADWKAWLRNLLRDSPAQREFQAVQRIAALGLPTFEPLALAITRRFGVTGETWLVSRAIPKAVPLDGYLNTEFLQLPADRQATLRQRLAWELGQLAAQLHAAGIEHIDLHAGNLLIRPDGDVTQPLLSLIDLHAVRFHSTLSVGRRERNLAILHQFFAGHSTRSDRRRFWLAYRAGTHPDTPRLRREREEVPEADSVSLNPQRLEQVLEEMAHAGWRRADRAWKRGNRHVRRLDAPHASCRGLGTLDSDWLTTIRDCPEGLFEESLVRWHKRSGRHRVAEVSLEGATPPPTSLKIKDRAGTPVEARAVGFWKEVAPPQGVRRLLSVGRMSSVRRAWEIGHALLRRGIDTPRPLLIVETPRRQGGASYLLTEGIAGSVTLDRFFHDVWPTMPRQDRTAWTAPRLARLARQLCHLHDCGFDHRDLKFSNLLVATNLADARLWLLDLDHVRCWPRLPVSRAVQNLARLHVSALQSADGNLRATDRLRFLRTYLGERFAPEWKRWWREIAERSRRKGERNRRLGRPLT